MKAHLKDQQKVPAWVEVAVKKVAALRFGTVHIVIHNGEVTQIESTEKIRLGRGLPEEGTQPS